jgi:radical SAM protein with 4Fe4S-binding SPASM domain
MTKIKSILAPSFLPATAVIETTYKCNHQCLFCSCPWEAPESKFVKHKELSIDKWKKIIKTLVEKGVLNIAFSGGEPLMKKGIEELIEFTSKLEARFIETENDELIERKAPPKIYVISNGGLMKEKFLDFCKKYNIHLSMSLPGLETYNYHTKSGKPENILHLFAEAKKRDISTTVNITATKKNIHELYETISNALIAGADNLLLNRFLPGGRGLKYRYELFMDVEETNKMLEIAEEVLLKANRKGSVGTELPKCLIKKEDFTNLKVGTKCSAAIDFFTIDPSGYIRACNHSENRLLHFSEYENLKTTKLWKKFVMKEYRPEMCKKCKYQYICDGGCREAANICGGCLEAEDPLFG